MSIYRAAPRPGPPAAQCAPYKSATYYSRTVTDHRRNRPLPQPCSSVANSPSSRQDAGPDKLKPGLYIVSTPIGNLQDITLRALNVLRAADAILAEDTRHSRKLLQAFNLSTPLFSFHSFNEKEKQDAVLERLAAGQAVALVSDAGTPAISDPGNLLVAAAVEAGHQVVPVPGASAVLAALVASGLPTSSFLFHGFLPPKTGARRKELEGLRAVRATLVFYVPPHGLRGVLADVATVLGPGRPCCLARELTKMHEEFIRGTVAEVAAQFEEREPRGEFVMLVGAAEGGEEEEGASGDDLEGAARELLVQGKSVSQVAKTLAQRFRVPKNTVYDVARRVQEEMGGA